MPPAFRLPTTRRSVPTAALAAAAVCAVCAAACGGPSPTAPDPRFPLVTDRASYTAVRDAKSSLGQYAFTVVARLRNESGATLYFEACGPSAALVYGIELVGGGNPDGSAYNAFYACTAGPPLTLAAGAERVDTLRLRGPNSFSDNTGLGAVRGRMRLVYNACTGRDACAPADARAVVVRSTTFTVTAVP